MDPEFRVPASSLPARRATRHAFVPPPRLRALLLPAIAGVLGTFLTGCSGVQSALDPAGLGAERIATLFWCMAGGATLIWLIVVGAAVYAIGIRQRAHSPQSMRLLIIGAGTLVPTLVLAGLLGYGLSMLPGLLEPAPEGSLRIRISGEQWWWRVEYRPPDAEPVTLANEIRLPVGEPVEFILSSPDVIHSFWIPSLGGKVDMIPGRVTRLTLQPTRTGVLRGVCAEFCGDSHALMAFEVVVLEKPAFEAWLAHERTAAAAPATTLALAGRDVFLGTGCGACHTVRGTPADGVIGPDLTHIGSRRTLAAGVLPNNAETMARWLIDPAGVKPGVLMPHFGMLPPDEITALAAYLEALR
jgi:cytochrome c oxidase subunit 2